MVKLATTVLVTCVGALLALGIVMLYSSKMGQSGEHFLVLQLAWCCVGLMFCLLAAAMDYAALRPWAWFLLGLFVLLLILVLIPIPHFSFRVNGARRWIGVPGIRFQPSELAKIVLVIALAYYYERNQRVMTQFWRGLVIPGAMIVPVLGLIFVEPDWGATLLLAAVSVCLLIIAGVRWRYFFPIIVLGAAGLAFMLMHNPVRLARMKAWLEPQLHKDGVGWQTCQSVVALGSGGWTGLGLGNSRQKWGFVPENHTDFILSVIGEELGLVATLGVLLAFVLIVICGMYIARQAREPFGFMLAAGLSLLIGMQAFINIGVVSGVLPNKGLPLPFISYGGSNLLAMLTNVGLLISVARRAVEPVSNHNPFMARPAAASLPF